MIATTTGPDAVELAGRYRFLSRLLAAPPDAELLADAETLGLIDAGWEDRLEQIQVEFTRLFSAPGPDAIPVHQSVYTDVLRIEPAEPATQSCGAAFSGGEFAGYLGGPCCAELRRCYAAAGYRPRPDEMPDHIAVELDFMAHLLLASAEAAEDFRARFLDRWVEVFVQRVRANTVSDFYRRVVGELLDLAGNRQAQPRHVAIVS